MTRYNSSKSKCVLHVFEVCVTRYNSSKSILHVFEVYVTRYSSSKSKCVLHVFEVYVTRYNSSKSKCVLHVLLHFCLNTSRKINISTISDNKKYKYLLMTSFITRVIKRSLSRKERVLIN